MDVVWDRLAEQDWADAAGPRAGLRQSWTYGAALTRLGVAIRRGEIRSGGAPAAVAQIIRRRLGPLRISAALDGPVMVPGHDHFRPAVLAFARAAAPLLIVVPPLGMSARAPGLPLMTGRTEAVLDLSAGAPELRKGLSAAWRNSLARAEATSTENRLELAQTGSVGDAADLIAAEAAQRHARGYSALPEAFLAAWDICAPGTVSVWTARRDGELVAGCLFLLHPPGATYHLAWTGEEGRRTGAQRLLLWRAMIDLRDRGITLLGLGALETVRAPGLARFKLGTGAKPLASGPSTLIAPFL